MRVSGEDDVESESRVKIARLGSVRHENLKSPALFRVLFRVLFRDGAQFRFQERHVRFPGANRIGDACDDDSFLGVFRVPRVDESRAVPVAFERYSLVEQNFTSCAANRIERRREVFVVKVPFVVARNVEYRRDFADLRDEPRDELEIVAPLVDDIAGYKNEVGTFARDSFEELRRVASERFAVQIGNLRENEPVERGGKAARSEFVTRRLNPVVFPVEEIIEKFQVDERAFRARALKGRRRSRDFVRTFDVRSS